MKDGCIEQGTGNKPISILTNTTITVSYTHLDVYKRQGEQSFQKFSVSKSVSQ